MSDFAATAKQRVLLLWLRLQSSRIAVSNSPESPVAKCSRGDATGMGRPSRRGDLKDEKAVRDPKSRSFRRLLARSSSYPEGNDGDERRRPEASRRVDTAAK